MSGWSFVNDLGDIASFRPGEDISFSSNKLSIIRDTREDKRKYYSDALNNTLDTLMKLENLARMDGFDVVVATSSSNGRLVQSDDGKLHIVTAYGVIVK